MKMERELAEAEAAAKSRQDGKDSKDGKSRDGPSPSPTPSKNRRYHMCLSGPRNVGKRLMATLIARILRRLGVVKKRVFVHLRNTTFKKFVNLAQVAEGGVIYVEDAKDLISDPSDKATLDKFEEVLRMAKTIVIFSGEVEIMKGFFNQFPSISDLVPYRHFTMSSLTKAEMIEIFGMIAKNRDQILQEGALKAVKVMLKQIPAVDLKRDNCRCLTRLLDAAQKVRDARISGLLAEDRPQLLRLLLVQDIKRAMLIEGFKYELEDQRSVHEMLNEEFKKVIGLDKIKEQLRKFAHTAERASLREEQGIVTSRKERFHMIFSGPPGTGKTMMANLVTKVLVKLDIVPSPNVINISKGADLCVGRANASQAKVDSTVAEAKGGVIFIDEAYTLAESQATGKEAIESIMKHLDPPKAVFIFAGYQVPMDKFLEQNEGLLRRVPYRFEFEPYTPDQLMEILKLYSKKQKLEIDEKELVGIRAELSAMGKKTIENRNASLVISWVQAAKREMDSRISFEEVQKDPSCLSRLVADDFKKAARSLRLRPDLDMDGLTVDEFLDREFKKVIGLEDLKKQIRVISRRVARDRLLAEKGISTGLKEQGKYHMVFSGNPGTGKSFVSSIVAKLLLRLGVVESDRVVSVRTGNALIDKHQGGTPDKVRSKVKEAKGGVLMIDEAYTLSQHLGPNQGSSVGAYGKEAIDTLMEFMSPPQLVMIFAGYEREMKDFLEVNQGLKRRIPFIFHFKDYTIEELVAIFNAICKSKGLTCEEGMDEELTKNLGFTPPRMLSERNGGAAADIINLATDFLSARVSTEEMIKNPKSAVHLHKADVKKAMVQLGFVRDYTGGGSVGADGKQQSMQEFLDDIFKKIIGHEDIKKMLRGFAKKIQADLKRAEIKGKADKRRHKDRYHMVFEGPPGTGKSMWAKAVAKILVRLGVVPHDEITEVSSPLNLLAGFQGQTPAKVDHVVQQARGGVVVIDEAYQLLTKSQSGGQSEAGKYAKEAIDTIMKHMDPPQCVFIFCGYEHPMEEFLKVNSGIARRLYKKFVFQPYSTEDLSKLFHVMLKSAGETLQDAKRDGAEVIKLLKNVPLSHTKEKNGGFVENWIQHSRLARDDLMDLDEMEAHPERLTQINGHHLKVGLSSLKIRIEINDISDEKLDDWLKKELAKIVGCRGIKEQIWRFRNQVAKDRLRRARGRKVKEGAKYHMIFSGPPGTGKTMIAKLMSKVMLKMGLVTNDRFVNVKNPLEFVDKYAGGTPHRVDHKVDQARGGVMFIDEAYSIATAAHAGVASYGQQAVNQLMAHMDDPPSCVFIFAGYEKPMKRFLGMNPGLERRIPFHYHFAPYSDTDLVKILEIQAKISHKIVPKNVFPGILQLLQRVPVANKKNENGGLMGRWLQLAAENCDYRVPLAAARNKPELLDTLILEDFRAVLPRLNPHKVRQEWELGENASSHPGTGEAAAGPGSFGDDAKMPPVSSAQPTRQFSGIWKGTEPADIQRPIKKTFVESFYAIDKSGSGFITPDELLAQYKTVRAAGLGAMLEQNVHQNALADFMRMDSDKDFKVSLQEYLDFFVNRGHVASNAFEWAKTEPTLRKALGLPAKPAPPVISVDDDDDDIYG